LCFRSTVGRAAAWAAAVYLYATIRFSQFLYL
jgi:hypothetical protein